MTAKDDEMISRFEAILEAKEAELEAAKAKKPTAVGAVMENGGGALTGAAIGWTAGTVVAAAAAPFTFGLSVLIPPLLGVAGGVYGHKASKDLDK